MVREIEGKQWDGEGGKKGTGVEMFIELTNLAVITSPASFTHTGYLSRRVVIMVTAGTMTGAHSLGHIVSVAWLGYINQWNQPYKSKICETEIFNIF